MGDENNGRRVRVGLMADPGVPSEAAASLAETLADELTRELAGRWEVLESQDTLPIDPNGEIPLEEHAPGLMEDHDWDVLIYLSDLPRYRDGAPLRYTLSTETPAAILFVPALGVVRQTWRIRRLVRDLIRSGARAAREDDSDRLWPPDTDELPRDQVGGRLAQLWLLLGMIRSNRPATMFKALGGCIAVAMASASFGIFFGSVWELADALSAWRLLAISALVVMALTTWLVIRNGLWSADGASTPGSRALDNAATLSTVGASVALTHVFLVLSMFVLALIVVESNYYESTLGEPVGWLNYVKLAWFSASLGTMAGALGSNFDHEDVVRETTYSQRWHERRKKFGDYDRAGS